MMQNNKKAPTGAATSAGAKETGAASRQATTSNVHDTTTNQQGQGLHVADFLFCGPENGITLRHLEKLIDLPGREVRRQIERERRTGALIISDNKNGYFLTDDPAEAERFANSMEHRAREILKTAQAIRKAAGCD